MPSNQIPGVPTGASAPTTEIPRAMPAGPDKPQFLQGKMTFIGLGLATVGTIAKMFGYTLPTDEAKDFLSWLSANWDVIASGLGLLTAAYGRLRMNWRKP